MSKKIKNSKQYNKIKSKDLAKRKPFTLTYLILFILIVIIPNLYFNKAMDKQLEIRMFGLSVFVTLLYIPLLSLKNNTKYIHYKNEIFKNPVIILYFILIFIIGLSVFWATNRSEAIYEFLKRMTFFALFISLLIYIFPNDNDKSALIKNFVVFSLIISLTGLFQIIKIFTSNKYSIDTLYEITGNFAQKNIFSEVLFISFSFCIYAVYILKETWKKLALSGLIINFLLIIFLMTRAIWIGIFISFFFSLVLFLLYIRKPQISNTVKKSFRIILFSLGLILIIFTLLTLTDKNKTLQNHISNAFNFKEGNTFHRLNLWEKTLDLANKNPIFGVGAGNWRINILQYDLQVFTERGRIMPDRAHNDFLQIYAENGLIGLLLLLLTFLLSNFYIIKMLKSNANFDKKFFLLILIFAFTGYIIDSLFAFPRERIELQIFLNIILALIIYEYNNSNQIKIDTKKLQTYNLVRWFSIPVIICSIITGYASYSKLKAEIGVKEIYKYISMSMHKQIIKTIDNIYSPFVTISSFGDPLMEIKAKSLYQSNADINLVLETMNKSLKDSPYHLQTYNDLAVIYWKMNNIEKAIEYCNTALKYSPNDIHTKIIIAKILLSENKMDEAYNILRNTHLNNDLKTIQNFKQTINVLLNYKISQISSQTNNQELIYQFIKSKEKENYFYNIYNQSIIQNEDFEKTLLKTILPLCNKEKINNDKKILELMVKYKIEI